MVFSFFSCKSEFSEKYKSDIVQTCLDHLYNEKKQMVLEQTRLVLVMDSVTDGLDNLHFGKNKIALKQVAPSDIKIYYLPEQDKSLRYLKIKYAKTDADHVTVVLELPNVNTWYTYYLKRNEDKWDIAARDLEMR